MVVCSLCCLLIVGRRDSVTSSSRSDSVSRASFDENVSFIIIVCVCVCFGVVTSCGLVQILTLSIHTSQKWGE